MFEAICELEIDGGVLSVATVTAPTSVVVALALPVQFDVLLYAVKYTLYVPFAAGAVIVKFVVDAAVLV